MSAGPHDLTPVQALQFVRQRHNLPGGDLAREKRQQYFISAAFQKITSLDVLLDPGKLSKLIDAVTGAFFVDDRGFSLLDLARQMSNLGTGDIAGYTIPTEGAGTEQVSGSMASVLLVKPQRVRAFVQRLLAPPAVDSQPAPVSSRPSTTAATGPPSDSATHSPRPQNCVY
jgi:anionic cell wall polymer biosynthesis LytR-Cps2A-Psr (LCP) family protein